MNNYAKFEEELTCHFKVDMRNLTNFDSSISKIFILMGSFWAKYILFELKKYRRAIFHETEEGCKIWRVINYSFQNWHKKFDKFWPEQSAVSEIFTLIVSFWVKYILFELKSTEELSLMKLKRDTKFGKEFTGPFNINIRNSTNFDLSTQKPEELLLS